MVHKWPFFQLFLRRYRPGKYHLRYSRTKKRLSGLWKKKFKKSKNWHFSKGVNPWFWSENGHFSNFFFWKYRPGNVFYDILEGKMPFSAIKTSSLKERKIDIFPKGLTHCFGPKMAIFPTFLFKPIRTRKMSFTIF